MRTVTPWLRILRNNLIRLSLIEPQNKTSMSFFTGDLPPSAEIDRVLVEQMTNSLARLEERMQSLEDRINKMEGYQSLFATD
jgi:hypothetical protein